MSANFPRNYDMADAAPGLNVLALNSGSSSLKFGMYCVRSSGTEMLLSGEAEAIGDKEGKFHAKEWWGNALVSETVLISNQQEAIIRIGRLLAASKMPAPAAIGHRTQARITRPLATRDDRSPTTG